VLAIFHAEPGVCVVTQQPWDVSYMVATSAGMCALWDPEQFTHVIDLDTWEDEVAEDAALVRKMEQAVFVPLNAGGDGAFQVVIRGGQDNAALSERESRYVLVSSQPYLLGSRGTVELGGLESIGGGPDRNVIRIPVEAGRYSVVVHLIDWKAESGALTADGRPSENALPDFLVIFGGESESASYRINVATFDRA
jgi:hypothetical protein